MLDGVDLDVAHGELAVLLGPSGAGKTTLLRIVCGLTTASAGGIIVDGAAVDHVAAHRRGIGLVFQEPRLFGHLTAVENVAFALRLRRVPRAARRATARALLDEVGLGSVADRSAAVLSGGEQQRVALARALAAEPRVLLLDEPFAAVDVSRRDELRRLLRRVQRERHLTTVLVTHDRAEAAGLADRVAIMIEGRVEQHDSPEVVFEQPATAAVARFLGAEVLTGTVRDGALRVAGADVAVDAPDGPVAFAIRPDRIRIDDAAPLRLRVVEARYAVSHARVVLAGGGIELVALVDPNAAPGVGTIVGVALPAGALWRLPSGPTLAYPPRPLELIA